MAKSAWPRTAWALAVLWTACITACGEVPVLLTTDAQAQRVNAATPTPTPDANNSNLVVAPTDPNSTVVSLSGCTSCFYTVPTSFGGQTLNLLLDSGSADPAVGSSTCQACVANTNQTYNAANAATTKFYTAGGYVDGSGWVGNLVKDLVAIGDASAPAYPPVQTVFASIFQETDFFEGACPCTTTASYMFDGILGVGPDAGLSVDTTADGATGLDTNHIQTVLTTAVKAGALPADRYAVQICNLGGRLWTGDYDLSAMGADPVWIPWVTKTPYATVALKSIQVGATVVSVPATTLAQSVLDTGTSAWLLPTATDYGSVTHAITGNANFSAVFGDKSASVFVLNDSASLFKPNSGYDSVAKVDAALPPVTFNMVDQNGTTYAWTIPASQSYLKPVMYGTILMFQSTVTASTGSTAGPHILGVPLMRSHTLVFDRKNQRTGFAPSVGCAATTESTTPKATSMAMRKENRLHKIRARP